MVREYEFDDNIELMRKELKQFVDRNSINAKVISLQVPEGLKRKALEIASFIEKDGYDVVLTTDPCWGACDLRVKEAEMVNADLIIHVGHKKFIKHIESKIPIMYFLWKYDIKYNEEKIAHELMKIKERKIGLICSVQYQDLMPDITEILQKIGKNVEMGGAVLGCWTENAQRLNVDTFVYIGSGNFHAIGAKCKYVLDMESEEVREITDNIMTIEKKRFASIEKARDGNIFALIVSSKPGQFELETAKKIKKNLQKKGKQAFLLIMDEITDIKLMGIDADVFVNTACVRIRDDYFSKPVLNPEDVDILLGEV
ncbi:MAG: diphthamide biosynthesis enzyme Dph2 [Candidatus Aenigmarchaeota archaeon]|nr:diphthamide biosynthesis enzyme Dph2 [Candidatus Aenigmarchaeota archaeon]